MVFVHMLPSLVPPDGLRSGVAVVIDVLRASTMMVHALVAGCSEVIPCAEVDEARALAAESPGGLGHPGRRAARSADRGIRPGEFPG